LASFGFFAAIASIVLSNLAEPFHQSASWLNGNCYPAIARMQDSQNDSIFLANEGSARLAFLLCPESELFSSWGIQSPTSNPDSLLIWQSPSFYLHDRPPFDRFQERPENAERDLHSPQLPKLVSAL
jgi:hypothetical protein